jgi:ParB-like chromosome segregation protein Spo0J
MNKMTNMAGLAVSYLSLSALKPYGNNARTHSRKQIAQVAGSIKSLGFNVLILIDEDNTVLAGHARLAAAKNDRLPELAEVAVTRSGDLWIL